ncbi:MAG: hypothetical protein D6761_00895 [Candidatus Dadabacteria bacterium]|nr:MAG: hypothetical protein D6761_00895 [Candidatus Dadabacteria bacterium]
MTRRKQRRAVLGCLVATMLAGCDFNPPGVVVQVRVDNLALLGQLKADQDLRIAGWVQAEAPREGERPDRVFHHEEVLDKNVLGTLDEICLTETNDPTLYTCTTHLQIAPGGTLWLGAFYEARGFADDVPDPGEFLSVTGPITIDAPDQKIDNLVITMRDPDAVSVPGADEAFAAVTGAIIDGDPEAFMERIHPLFYNDWGIDFDQFAAWVTGAFANTTQTFGDPLTAPLAGFWSSDVRTRLNIQNVQVSAEPPNGFSLFADVSYVAQASRNQSTFPVVERWKVDTLDAIDQRLISSINVLWQNVDETVIGVAEIEPGPPAKLTVGWSNTGNPDSFTVSLDQYDSARFAWDPVTSVSVAASVNTCSFGTSASCVNGLPVTTSAFYRVQVIPVEGGTARRASSAFVSGEDYQP